MLHGASWEATWFSASQEIPRILWNPKAFTSVRHLSLSRASSIQSILQHLTLWRFILILSSHLHLVLSSGLFPSGFPTKILYTPLLSTVRATCPTYLILLDFITQKILGEEYRSLGSTLCSLLHSPLASSLLGPNILFSTLFSNNLSLRSYTNVRETKFHTHAKQQAKILFCIP